MKNSIWENWEKASFGLFNRCYLLSVYWFLPVPKVSDFILAITAKDALRLFYRDLVPRDPEGHATRAGNGYG
jgi:hypothetical protein